MYTTSFYVISPLAALLLDHASGRAAIRLSRLDNYHLLRMRAENLMAENRSRLGHISRLPPQTIHGTDPLLSPIMPPSRTPGPQPTRGSSKPEQALSFLDWASRQHPRVMWVFSDGSKLPDGRAGAGWALIYEGALIGRGNSPCGDHAEVYDAEATRLLGCQAALAHPLARHAQNLWACLDNSAVVSSVLWPAQRLSSESHL
jgi:hypothetical protein